MSADIPHNELDAGKRLLDRPDSLNHALAVGVSKAQIVLDFADSQENRMDVAARAS